MKNHEYFNDISGHLTDFALREIVAGEPAELHRLEIAEHLSFCDHCLERYTAALEGAPLLEPGELFVPSVMRALRRKVGRVTASRYFTVAVSACVALVFWVTGVFNVSALRVGPGEGDRPAPGTRTSITEMAGGVLDSWAGSMSEFFESIDLRGVFYDEKE